MKVHSSLRASLTAGAFLLIGALAVAQTTPVAKTVQPRDAASGQASGRQDLQKKHIAGVKYEDRAAGQSQDAQSGQPSAKGIQEKGLKSPEAEQTNKMAIKENGLPASKPKPKPKP